MKEKKKQIYCDFNPDRILIVTYYNKLMVLYCPFPLRFNKNIKKFKKGQVVQAKKVGLCTKGTYVFFIDTFWFHYYHFEILCYNL
ncbi:hypothetical protein [Pseudotenacibaculum haliotis]|uniref:Uncharacterized protein n=1 Tax=Pseudotenacibaculum haliotis TaxID=1862138 RepID=A0ABW5LV89_9FLAO